MDEIRVKDTERLFKKANMDYALFVKNISKEQFLQYDDEERTNLLSHWAGTLEKYFKAFARWKGEDMKELKNIGHKLEILYDILDDEVKKYIEAFSKLTKAKAGKIDSSDIKNIDDWLKKYDSICKSNRSYYEASNMNFSLTKNSLDLNFLGCGIRLMSARNGKFDGEGFFPEGRITQEGLSIVKIIHLIREVDYAEYRYEKDFHPSDKLMTVMYDLINTMHTLSLIALGKKNESRSAC